ncbi:MAG: MBL fold metallo-hydrolase [Ilumatobacter sp.]|uniref:MBL fold metallo-hydrolase n=1 Tax=Ilumatobacter sp. TaxID=1967498 RepID=UPI00262B4817|nr:MBL fold metallo-hydrolase [Ilumatobacter sp.]MDJ0771520.1 MBL fold metallo-hydrolase [Ilumatobacter sp.]
MTSIGGFDITFHGVRGSTPCHGDDIRRYGGNTSCVSVALPEHDPIFFDVGTGARYFGGHCNSDRPFRGTCLLTHLHWDHLQGLPFFPPLLKSGGQLDIHAPLQDAGASLHEVFGRSICPPLFPVGLDALPGDLTLRATGDDDFMIGEANVMSRFIPHVGPTLGYRLEWGGASVAYLSDHQQPGVELFEATDNAKELCRDVDVLIHDAQYTPEEFIEKTNWGHCTIDYAVWLAAECNVKTLVLFHHDPLHDDDMLDKLIQAADESIWADGMNVIGAYEGLVLRVGG